MKQAHNDEIPAYEKDPVFEEVFKLTPRCSNCGQPTADNQDLVPKKLIKELVDYIDSVRRFG